MTIDNEIGKLIRGSELTEEIIDKWINKNVCIFVSSKKGYRNGFHSQIAINGILEKHSKKEDLYRVLVSKDTYSYFELRDIESYSITYSTERPNIELII